MTGLVSDATDFDIVPRDVVLQAYRPKENLKRAPTSLTHI